MLRMALRAGSGFILAFVLCLSVMSALAPVVRAADSHAALTPVIQKLADDYLVRRAKTEHISAVSVSISFPGEPANLNLTSGHVSLAPGAAALTPASLFQIGSITKSFTAAALLQLEAEGKLKIDQPIGDWLPEYPAWREVTIRRLLDMTSGIRGYDHVSAFLKSEARYGIHRRWSDAVLVGFADPSYPGAPKPTKGYDYSNTNYILAGMIIERAAGASYAEEIQRRFFGPRYGLTDSFYSPNVYPEPVLDRLVSGYYFNDDPEDKPIASLRGTDMKDCDMSWAAAAGGIVATPEDVTRWVRALFQGTVLAPAQQQELRQMISLKTGKPIAKTSLSDHAGFALGVVQATNAKLGTFWAYEGSTLGYRVAYVLVPDKDLVIAVGLNSQAPDTEDKINSLITDIYTAIVK